jgi:aminopeptidase N
MTPVLLTALLAAVAAQPPAAPVPELDSLMVAGISAPLAERRATAIHDVRYDLRLDVTQRDTARGHVRIRFTHTGGEDVILDFRGLRIGPARVNGAPPARLAGNGAHVRIPAALLRPGENELAVDFASAIAPAGASVIRYHDPSDGADYLYTLLVPADANQLFPCFDQPDLKARVRLALTVPRGWTALANGAVVGADSAAAATTFRFAETQPISTYLIAFAAGPWATVRGEADGHDMTLYVRRSRAGEVEADSLLALNGKALRWLGQYFGIEYPFGKFDFLLAPAFPFGGMEHPGAVFYNEDSFIFRERPTRTRRIGRAATVYHEVAHQWFGDLVTMRWFDDLWLKEGFATYMAAKAQAALEPDADAWKSFYLRNKPAAYGVDVTEGTTPVWQELANLDQAKSNYGAIVYNKAPGVLKQLDYLVGDDAFRTGVSRFLREHAYGNATWRDLLHAVAGDAGNLDAWGEQYILRPGMPMVQQLVDVRDGRLARLRLVQRPVRELSGPAPWPMRLEVLVAFDDGTSRRIPVELRGDTTDVPLPGALPAPTFVFANAGDYGYALTVLDPRSTAWLERHIGTVRDDFLRAMLWGALWDAVRDARLSPARFLDAALRELPAERDEQIASALVRRVVRATNAYLGEAELAARLPAVERLLATGAADSGLGYDLRKAQLDGFLDVAATPAALSRVDALLDADSAAGAPLRPPTRWAAVTRLVETGAPTADARLAELSARDTTSDGRRRAFVAGAARPDAAVKRDYFTRYLRDSTLNEDWATASLGAFNALRQQELTLPYLAPALDTLPWIQRNRRIFFLGSWLGAFLGGHTSPEALAVVRQHLAAHPELAPDLRAKVLQALDELERTVRIRAAY